MKRKLEISELIFKILSYLLLTIFALMCLYPFVYAVSASISGRHAVEYSEWLVPGGIPAYRPDGSAGIASGYFGYQPDEAYDLYYGRASLHTAGNEGAADNQAADVAERLLEIP